LFVVSVMICRSFANLSGRERVFRFSLVLAISFLLVVIGQWGDNLGANCSLNLPRHVFPLADHFQDSPDHFSASSDFICSLSDTQSRFRKSLRGSMKSCLNLYGSRSGFERVHNGRLRLAHRISRNRNKCSSIPVIRSEIRIAFSSIRHRCAVEVC